MPQESGQHNDRVQDAWLIILVLPASTVLMGLQRISISLSLAHVLNRVPLSPRILVLLFSCSLVPLFLCSPPFFFLSLFLSSFPHSCLLSSFLPLFFLSIVLLESRPNQATAGFNLFSQSLQVSSDTEAWANMVLVPSSPYWSLLGSLFPALYKYIHSLSISPFVS
jgi:hypothetical protein